MLLDAGAKVKPVGSEMPLFQTIMTPCSKDKAKDKVAIVQLLLDAGAPIRGSYEGKKTSALHLCGQVVHGNDGAVDAAVAQVAALLLARDPQLLELKDSQGRTPLIAVAASHNVKVAEVLVQSGADVTVCDSINKPLVHCALAAHRDLSPYRYFPKDRRTVLRMLLEAGADPIPCDKFGRTVLMTLVSPLRLQFSVPDSVAAFFIGDVADAILARG
jgi:ankyrin repeat protein